MLLHNGLRFYLKLAEFWGLKKFQVPINNKWYKFLSELYYSIHFVLFLSFYLLYIILYIPKISQDFRKESEKNGKSNDSVSTILNYFLWYYGFIYSCLSFTLLIYSRTQSEKFLHIVRSLKKGSSCNENYLFFLFSFIITTYDICFSITSEFHIFVTLKGKPFFLVLHIIVVFHTCFLLINFQCLYICLTEQISSKFKKFNIGVSKLEKTLNKIIYFHNNEVNEIGFISKFYRIIFSMEITLEEFYSYFQKPICLTFSFNLLFLICNTTRLAKYGFQDNFLSIFQAIFIIFLIIFVSDVIIEQVS